MNFDKNNSDLTNSPCFPEAEVEARNRRLEIMMSVMQSDLDQIKQALNLPKLERFNHQMTGIKEDEREDLYVTDSSPRSSTDPKK
jgi:hypothetical protein